MPTNETDTDGIVLPTSPQPYGYPLTPFQAGAWLLNATTKHAEPLPPGAAEVASILYKFIGKSAFNKYSRQSQEKIALTLKHTLARLLVEGRFTEIRVAVREAIRRDLELSKVVIYIAAGNRGQAPKLNLDGWVPHFEVTAIRDGLLRALKDVNEQPHNYTGQDAIRINQALIDISKRIITNAISEHYKK